MHTACSAAAVACRGFGRRRTWETLACTGRFDPNILRAALPQNGVDEGTGTFYVNGLQVEQLADFKTGFLKLKVGINRVSQNNWKGHIDELKIYNRSLSASEICNLYKNHGTLNAGATCETPNNVSR